MEKTQSQCSCKYTAAIFWSCLIGLVLSIYATHVELNKEKDDDYRAMCDISEKISCTKVFSSRYGKGFGLAGPIFGQDSVFNSPNGKIGVVFYIIIALLGFINNPTIAKIQVIFCVISNLLSLYLAYLLYFVLEDFCVVCVSTYAVNLANLLIAWKRYNHLQKVSSDSSKKVD